MADGIELLIERQILAVDDVLPRNLRPWMISLSSTVVFFAGGERSVAAQERLNLARIDLARSRSWPSARVQRLPASAYMAT
jgi:hypothetical protein